MTSNTNKKVNKHPFRGLRKVVFCIIKLFLIPYVRLVQNVRFKKNGFRLPKEPCFFISNHQSNWDGVYVNLMFFNRCIYFLMHDELFRYKSSKFLFQNLLGMVPRTNSKSNLVAINTLVQLRDEGENIGLYPEGDINYWGKSTPNNKSAAKLVKLLKMPVVLMNISGAHLRVPRWGKWPARSRITYEIKEIISAEDVKALSINDVHDKIETAIAYDENEFQKKNMIKLRGKSHAENLELGLYVCPECGSFSALKSKGSRFFCTKCGMRVRLNAYDMFERYEGLSEGKPRFDLPTEWNDWQTEVLRSRLSGELSDDAIYSEDKVYVTTASMDTAFPPLDKITGRLTLYPDRLVYSRPYMAEQVFPLPDIEHVTLQFKTVLEFYHNNLKYRFESKKPPFSAYMWEQTINLLKSKN